MQEGIKAMWEAGGDLDSTFDFAFARVPVQNPTADELCVNRRIQPGDVGVLTAHSEYQGYAGHSDQVISFGKPSQLHCDMFDASLYVREAVLEQVKAGATQDDLDNTYERAILETGFRPWPHRQIHQYGIDVPESPGPAWTVKDKASDGALGSERAHRTRNFAIAAGMIYSISPVVKARQGNDTILGGTSLVVTQEGYRNLDDRKVELLVVD